MLRLLAIGLASITVAAPMPSHVHRAPAAAAPCQPSSFCATIVVTSVAPAGWTPGNGRVTSDPVGLDCTFVAGVAGGGCQQTFNVPAPPEPADSVPGKVTLAFAAAEFSVVRSGSSDLATPTPSAQTIELDVTYTPDDPTVTVEALGFVVAKHQLTVGILPRGMPPRTGRVTGDGVDCRNTCATAVDHGKVVELHAEPDAGSVFTGWEGACQAQQGPFCRLVVTTDLATDATFGPPPPPGGPGGGDATPTKPLRGELLSVRTGRSKSGLRVVLVELRLEDEASGTLTLTRGEKTLATKTLSPLTPGHQVLSILVPARVRAGPATVTLDLTGLEGARVLWGHPLVLPKQRRR